MPHNAAAGAAEVTGLIQQALERMHQLVTYELSSSMSMRFESITVDVRRQLVDARRLMADLALQLGKEWQ